MTVSQLRARLQAAAFIAMRADGPPQSGEAMLIFRQPDGKPSRSFGTRKIGVRMTMTRLNGFSNDGDADNLELVLHAGPVVPEPAAGTLLLAGALVLLGRGRRRRGTTST